MKAVTKITLTTDHGDKFFGEGPARLLRQIEKNGSLRTAALSMEMAYSKATKLLKQAEDALGFPLTTRTTGGKHGGGSTLTPEAVCWLTNYEAYRDACLSANQALFQKYFPRKGCVIMASGMASRFGSNKLLADFHGEPMICRVLSATEGLFDERVVVTRHEEVAALCREREISVVLHDLPDRNDTVRLGLEALSDVQCCMFCSGDQPLLSKSTVASLLDHWDADREQICRPISGNTPGSPVLFPAWAFPELKSLPQGMGGSLVMKNHPEKISLVPIDDPYELMDADTPQMLELLKLHHMEGSL